MDCDILFLHINEGLVVERSIEIDKELEKLGLTSGHLCEMRFATEQVRKAGRPCLNMDELLKEAGGAPEPTLETIRRYEEKYDLPPITQIYWGERTNRYETGRERWARRTVATLRVFEHLFETHRVRSIFQVLGSEITRQCAYWMGRAHNAPVIMTSSPLYQGHCLLYGDMHAEWEDPRPIELPEITDEERAAAREWMRPFVERRKVLGGVRQVEISQMPVSGSVRRLWRHVLGLPEETDWRTPTSRIGMSFGERFVRSRLNRAFYTTPDYEKPFVYLPMHFPLDMQILIRAPQFWHQEFLVEYASRCVPHGYELWIKEHPNAIGYFPTSMLRFIKRHTDNVRILPPETNSHDVIEKAECVLVVNSTVGFEALMHYKPVVNLATPYYAHPGVTRKVDDLRDLPRALQESIRNGADRDMIERFVHRFRQVAHEGSMWFDDNRLDKLAESLKRYLGKHAPAL